MFGDPRPREAVLNLGGAWGNKIVCTVIVLIFRITLILKFFVFEVWVKKSRGVLDCIVKVYSIGTTWGLWFLKEVYVWKPKATRSFANFRGSLGVS
ncbi:hypothetical protein DIT68_02425 [Brumimicrobium oceani]|uniref:Uncharacterized protein n=1 Tax=Brumimicrobium oceani TaxID=2100725 RepID=A0A2U2XH60_9FLAO|nr:hypothetical protein DIT68_02425 [Brumimicrobium oceani]